MNTQSRITEALVDDALADQELGQRVQLYLVHSGHACLRSLGVYAHNGVITLRGIVPRFYARQVAMSCAQRVAGVREIVDEIEVGAPLNHGNHRPLIGRPR